MKKNGFYIFIVLSLFFSSCKTIDSKDLPSWVNSENIEYSGFVFFKTSIKTGSSSRSVNEDVSLNFITSIIVASMDVMEDSPVYKDVFDSVANALKSYNLANPFEYSENIDDKKKKSSEPLEQNITDFDFLRLDNVGGFINTIQFHNSKESSAGNFLSTLVVLNKEWYDFYSKFYKFYDEVFTDQIPMSYSKLKDTVSQTNDFVKKAKKEDYVIASNIYNLVFSVVQKLELSLSSSSFEIRLNATNKPTFSGIANIVDLPIVVSFQVAGGAAGERVGKSLLIRSNSEGKFQFAVESVNDKGAYTLSFRPDLRGLYPVANTADETITDYANRLKVLGESKVLNASYNVFSNASTAKTAILIYDLDRAGNRLTAHETANGLEMFLQQKGFNVDVVTLDNDLSRVSEAEFIRVVKEKFATTYDRIVIGVSSLDEFSDDQSQISLVVKGYVLVYDFKTDEIIYRKEEKTNSRGNDLNATVMLGYRGLGRIYGQDFLISLP
ncbi:MAG: hypothetical protein JXR63_04335 [Spirochaetales bacterium]|nr:hypothetical protein [Spirochaetales bacterium]